MEPVLPGERDMQGQDHSGPCEMHRRNAGEQTAQQYRWCIIELYTWNLYNFISQHCSNKFNKIYILKQKGQWPDLEWQSLFSVPNLKGKRNPRAEAALTYW